MTGDRMTREESRVSAVGGRTMCLALTGVIVAAAGACGGKSVTGPSGGGGTDSANVTLAVGDVAILGDSAQLGDISIAATSGTSKYVIIVGNADTVPHIAGSFSLASASPTMLARQMAAGAPLYGVRPIAGGAPRGRLSSSIETRIRRYERARFPFAATHAAALARRSLVTVRGSGVGASPSLRATAVPTVGQAIPLKAPTADTALCTDFVQTMATVRAVSTHAIVVEDTLDREATGGFSTAQWDSIATEYDRFVIPTDSAHFGNPTDVDSNSHIYLFFTGRVNKLSPRGSNSFVGGFFFAGDLFPDSTTHQGGIAIPGCGESNYAELFYLLAPDPTGVFSDAQATATVRQITRGTVAHEMQHMINAGNRIYNDPLATAYEVAWLDEGLAHSAEDWVGRAEDGFTDLHKLTWANITAAGVNDFDAFFFQNAARYQTWLDSAATSGVIDTVTVEQSLAVRGAAWSLVEYLADRYSGGNVATFTHGLAFGPGIGIANIVSHAGVPWDSVLAGWLVANYASGLPVAGLDSAAYTFAGYDMGSVQVGLAQAEGSGTTYPLVVTTASPTGSSGVTLSGSVQSGAGAYYVATTTGAAFHIKLQGSGGHGLPFTGARVYIIRTE